MRTSRFLPRRFRLKIALAASLALLVGSALPGAPGAAGGRAAFAAQAPKTAERPEVRRDTELGTRDENMDFGRDPKTGDIYFQIDPPRAEPVQPSTRMGPIYVEPEVKFGRRYYNNQGGYGYGGGAPEAPPAGGGVYYYDPGAVKGP